ncbi:Virulence-protein E, N-terminal [uncultured Caudovirales phage]|uniref:Virulence-protein E, N-terminal n=1 Tax=uncultured Caudovirales phage TaxID=2100421 RepID=A0A6J5L4X6_9CAUD|nr:Virulence-protein E, N-terminal [uncultured Caudovirales phage]
MNVSIFKTINDTTGGIELNVEEVFEGIRSGYWVQHVEKVRGAKDKEEQRKLKKSVPYFTASGTFTHRKDDGLKHHSGIIAIDFDDLEDVNDAKSYLCYDRYSWFTCESISGKGLCVFVKIDPQKHRESFDFLERYYFDNYKLVIDKACKDISRPRFVTFDPSSILNESAVRLSLDNEKQFDPERIISIAENMIRNASDGERHARLLKASRLMGGYIGGGLLDEMEVEQRLKNVWNERTFDASYNYEQTIIDGLQYGQNAPITLEQYSEKIKENAEEKKKLTHIFNHARELNRAGRQWNAHDVINMGELHFINKDKIEKIFKKVFDEEKAFFGFEDKPKHVKTEIIVADKWEFRRNVVTQSTDYRVRANANASFERVNYDSVTRYVLHCGQNTSPDKIKSLLRSDFVPEYDPLKTYFLNLQKWDGKTDFIGLLAEHINTDDQEFFVSMFKKHLVRSVSQIMSLSVNRFVFVLVGEKQASGKSTFIRNLSPFKNGMYYTESKVRDDKDGQFAFAENFIYNIEELSDMKNTDVNRLKAMISQAIIKERKPYAHDVEAVARRCSFFGSTNNAQFLTDTENTRWLCFNVKSINWNYTKIDISDVWSQAFALWQDKEFNDQLTEAENEHQAGQNKNYEVSDLGKELISKYLKKCLKDDKNSVFYTIADIVALLSTETAGMVKFNDRIIGKNLIQLGFIQDRKKINGQIVRGYYGKPIKGQYLDIDEVDPVIEEISDGLPY